MKTIKLLIALLILTQISFSQSLIIFKKDNSQLNIPLTDIDSITFTTQDDTIMPPEEFAPPGNFKAVSLDGGVKLSWIHSTSVGGSDFAGYRIITRYSGNIVDSIDVSKTVDTHTVSGLTNGISYIFSIRSVKNNGDVSIAASLNWGPTVRFNTVRIYEFDSNNPAGLQLSTGIAFSFTSFSPDNRPLIDLWLDGRDGATPLLKSPDDQSITTGWRITKLIETNATSLDQQVTIPPLSNFRTTPGLIISANRVYLAVTQDGNYVRFQTSAIQGTIPDRYVDITITYNTGAGAWAKR